MSAITKKKRPNRPKQLTDRDLLRMTLESQAALAKILYLLNINQRASDAAASLHASLVEVLKEIVK